MTKLTSNHQAADFCSDPTACRWRTYLGDVLTETARRQALTKSSTLPKLDFIASSLLTRLLSLQVAHIFGWVTDALRDPGHTFELITPERRPLVTSAGTVARAGLLPSSLLNFRWGEIWKTPSILLPSNFKLS